MENPEKRFITNLSVVLKKIKSELLHTASNRPIRYKISHLVAHDYPSRKEDVELIYKLQEEGIIEILNKAHDFFELKVNNEKFNEIYTTLDDPFNADETIVQMLSKKRLQNSVFEYDVVFSLAGEKKEYVEKVATYIKEKGLKVWFYKFEEVELWGKNQVDAFSEIFTKSAKYCVLFISQEYTIKVWPNLERQFIQSRWLKDPNYLLPARFDDSLVVGIPDTVGYISLKNLSPEQFGDLIVRKVKEISSSTQKDQPQYQVPKLKQSFNVYQEKDTWIQYIVDELRERTTHNEQMDYYSDIQSEKAKIRILLKGETVYSLNIYKDSMGSERGLSFYGVTGEMSAGSSNSYNAWGEFLWSKEKEQVVLNFYNMSLLRSLFASKKKEYTKKEFVDALWDTVVDHLNESY